jgi:proline iminopeptidase
MLEERVRVLRWEQRGCGRSTADGRYDLATTLDDMEAIRRHHGFSRWIVGGHSWGADLALAYAWHYPKQTAGLVAISGGLLSKDRSWSEAYHAGKDGRGEAQPPYAYEGNREVNRVLNASWREFTHRADLWRRASMIDCPALWIYSENDIRPSWPEQQVATLLPRGEFRLIAGAEHAIWLTHAPALRAELLSSLDRGAQGA